MNRQAQILETDEGAGSHQRLLDGHQIGFEIPVPGGAPRVTITKPLLPGESQKEVRQQSCFSGAEAGESNSGKTGQRAGTRSG